MTRSFSRNQLPVRAASSLSLVRISKGRWKRRESSSCHCSTRLPGQTMRQRWRSPRAISSLMRRPAMMVLPAPGSSARRTERLTGQHRFIDSGDLVGQRLDQRGVHGEYGVEKVGETDAMGLGCKPVGCAIAVEAPRPASLNEFDGRFVLAVEEAVGDFTIAGAIHEGERIGAVPLNTDGY
jgi:hypothetical protein